MGKKRKREDEAHTINSSKSYIEEATLDVANDDFEGFDDEYEKGEIPILSDEDNSDSKSDSGSTSDDSVMMLQEEQAPSEGEKG